MSFPQKIYIESTTRCNLRCSKCIKQIEGSSIQEADFPLHLFQRLASSLARVDSLILNGIGEPLLHPDLPEMTRLARSVMPNGAGIGFQSNGILLTPDKAQEIIDAGISTVCLSLDSLKGDTSGPLTSYAPAVASTINALNNLSNAAKRPDVTFKTGLEIVVSKQNVHELPDMVRWAGEHGVDFIIVTHLFAYNKEMAQDSLFGMNSSAAVELFDKYLKKAASLGIELKEVIRATLRSQRMRWDPQTTRLLQEMRNEAAGDNLHLHFANLLNHDENIVAQTTDTFERTQQLAGEMSIDLRLPVIQAQEERLCPFMEDKAVFIHASGDVMPCHFLWHSYPCMGGNDTIMVRERSFGNIHLEDLESIWQSKEYHEFRHQAEDDNYSRCWSCPQSPCEDLINTNLLGINDCFGSTVPCGHCRWSIGGLHCL